MVSARHIVGIIAASLVACVGGPLGKTERQLVGTWHWSDRYTEYLVLRDLTLNADRTFIFATSYSRGKDRPYQEVGDWRLSGGVLKLHFPEAQYSGEGPYMPDWPLPIVSANTSRLVVKRGGEDLALSRTK